MEINSIIHPDLIDGSNADDLHDHTEASVIVTHASTTGQTTDDHHTESHTIASHSDTSATGAELDTLTDNSMADALHRHSELSASDGTPDAVVQVNAAGTFLTLSNPATGVVTRIRADGDTAGDGGASFDLRYNGSTLWSLLARNRAPVDSLQILNSTGAARMVIDQDGSFTFTADTDTDLPFDFVGTTNSGVFTWMEDEDYFKFGDDIGLDNFEELRFYDDGGNYVGFEAPALTADQIWVLPAVDGDADDIIKTDGAGNLDFVTATVDIPIVISMYNPVPVRNNENNINGGLQALSIGDTLETGTDIVVSKGTGKIVLVVIASNDAVGDITVTGDTVDRDTGVVSAADTDTITLDGNSTDNSTTGGKGGAIVEHSFVDAYITSKWFTGTVTLSTTEVELTDVDVYHVSFEQFNDNPDMTINTLDASLFTTNAAAEFDAYLFTLHKDAGDKCHIDTEAQLHIGSDAAGETAIANKYWRLRNGVINAAIDGTTDGFWMEVWYLNNPTYVEDVTLKLWATKEQALTLT